MIIGVPKEIKLNEGRVALTPAGANQVVKQGHELYIQTNAGLLSGYQDSDYTAVGAKILDTAEEVFQIAEMIVKVKEPLPQEYNLIKKGQIVFTYFHFSSSEELTNAMLEREAICITYETITSNRGTLPLLTPMSEVAGRMSVQQGAKFLEAPLQGKGILLGGVPGVKPANVVVIGGGVVGTEAAKMAAGLGANVNILDINMDRLRYLDDVLPANVTTEYSNEYNVRENLKNADLVIGAVLIPGAKAPKLVTKDMLKDVEPGTVFVDVAIDQGGCFETAKPTTHKEPTYIVDDVVHYCVANIPGAVPYTSTLALTNVTLPFVVSLANKGWKEACAQDAHLKNGINIAEGKCVYKPVADAFGLELNDVEALFEAATC